MKKIVLLLAMGVMAVVALNLARAGYSNATEVLSFGKFPIGPDAGAAFLINPSNGHVGCPALGNASPGHYRSKPEALKKFGQLITIHIDGQEEHRFILAYVAPSQPLQASDLQNLCDTLSQLEIKPLLFGDQDPLPLYQSGPVFSNPATDQYGGEWVVEKIVEVRGEALESSKSGPSGIPNISPSDLTGNVVVAVPSFDGYSIRENDNGKSVQPIGGSSDVDQP